MWSISWSQATVRTKLEVLVVLYFVDPDPMAATLLPSPLLASCVIEEDEYELRCPICFAIMLRPRLLPGCEARHTFCCECIDFWLQLQQQSGAQRTCPIDRRVLPSDERPTVDAQLEAIMKKRNVRCPNSRLGCDAVFALEDGMMHLQACRFRTVQCSHCQKPQSAEALPRHIERCYRLCDTCGVPVPRVDSTQHAISLCLGKPHGWRSTAEAKAFCTWRKVVIDDYSWLATHCSGVLDWQRLHASVLALMEEYGMTATAADGTAGDAPSPAHFGEEGDGFADEGGEGAQWLQLSEVCRLRGWRGPRLAFAWRSVDAEPNNLEALLALGRAQLESGMAAAGLESFRAVGELDGGRLEQFVGQVCYMAVAWLLN